MDESALIALFERVGIEPARAKVTVKNKKFSSALAETIKEAGCEAGAGKAVGVLLDGLAGSCPEAVAAYRPFIARKIAAGALETTEQVNGMRR